MARTTDATRKQPEQTATPAEHACLFIKLGEVKLLTTFSTSEIYRRIAAGTFPAQVMLGPKSAVWIKTEILDWCEARIAESREAA